MKNPLLDNEFLIQLDEHREKEIYARIISLNFNEEPLEQIEGSVTGGSINIDGSSAVRRTCSLTLVANNVNITDYYWGLKNKFKLEIGLKNTINDIYPDIIWFPFGVYVIASFATSYNTNSYTISISGKDKMCLLNGDMGGSLPSQIDFGCEEYWDKETNVITKTSIPIKKIIKETVHAYGGEAYENIVINDLEDSGFELLEYRGDGDTPMYIFYNQGQDTYDTFTLKGNVRCQPLGETELIAIADWDKEVPQKHFYDHRLELDQGLSAVGSTPTIVSFPKATDAEYHESKYTICKITYGDTPGYRITDLTYAGDLIANVGETITSVLDKIKNMLSEYEYFYDIQGRFIFQKKKTYLNTVWTNITKIGKEEYVESAAQSSAVTYTFKDSNLITAFQNTPALNNLKNDYAIWGQRKGTGDAQIPIHLRYAIDHKPEFYRSFDGTVYTTLKNYENENEKIYKDIDWREIIYQMSLDYFQHNEEDNYNVMIVNNNLRPDGNGSYYPTGRTGYEQYYTDLQGFWRQLYDIEPDEKRDSTGAPIYGQINDEDGYSTYWARQIKDSPETLNFWFDFLDDTSDMGQYSVHTIGPRAKSVNDNDVTAIYFREVPNVIFTTPEEYKDSEVKEKTGYSAAFIRPEMENLFSISGQGKSAKDVLDDMLYNYAYCTESITLTTIPIYYLQPNTRIRVSDKSSNIDGEYLVSRISFSLTYNGTMSISATKAPERLN